MEQYNAATSQYGNHEKLKDSRLNGIMENQDLIMIMYGNFDNYHKSMQGFQSGLKVQNYMNLSDIN